MEMKLTKVKHYINKTTGEAVLFIDNGKMIIGKQEVSCVIFQPAIKREKEPWMKYFAMEVKEFLLQHDWVKDCKNKYLLCLKSPEGELMNRSSSTKNKFEAGKYYQVIESDLAEGQLIIHTSFGQGILLYAPDINMYFDVKNPLDNKPEITSS